MICAYCSYVFHQSYLRQFRRHEGKLCPRCNNVTFSHGPGRQPETGAGHRFPWHDIRWYKQPHGRGWLASKATEYVTDVAERYGVPKIMLRVRADLRAHMDQSDVAATQ